MATYVVGDVHGSFRTLRKLLASVDFDAGRDRLWLIGDLVNRGPESLSVLRWARDTQHRMGERMVAVLGNHDLHLIARYAGVAGRKGRDTLEDVLAAADRDELVDWLRRRPLLHRNGRHLVVHAGLLPSWTPAEAERLARRVETVLRSPDGFRELITEPWESEGSEVKTALAVFTRLRTCTDDERLCDFAGPPARAPPGCTPWFEVPGRRSVGVHVLFGHWAALGLYRGTGVTALDSGAAWGRWLSAMRLEDGKIFQEKVTETAPA